MLTTNKLERVFHNFNLWEDNHLGMYKTRCFMDEGKMIQDCILLLSCPDWFSDTAYFILTAWPFAVEHNLTNYSRNRQAWLGQAACCLMHGAPEYLVKQAWNMMNKVKQDAANKVADEVIAHFEKTYSEKRFQWQN